MLLNCVLEKTPESPLDCKEIKPVNSEGYQSCIDTLLHLLNRNPFPSWLSPPHPPTLWTDPGIQRPGF